MFSCKKPDPPKRKNRDLKEFGSSEISDDPNQEIAGDDNNGEVEVELAAIPNGGGSESEGKLKPTVINAVLDKMVAVADSIKDIGSDEELSGDDDDPDLLSELLKITGETIESPLSSPSKADTEEEKPEQILLPTTTSNIINIIRQRIEIYILAEEFAEISGEAGKSRRFNRGLITLQDLLKQANDGKSINIDDIPPEVFVKKPVSTPDSPNHSLEETCIRPAPAPPPPPTL